MLTDQEKLILVNNNIDDYWRELGKSDEIKIIEDGNTMHAISTAKMPMEMAKSLCRSI